MNNEETIIMKPQAGNSDNKTTQSQPTAQTQAADKTSNTGKKVATTAGAAVLGGAAGAAGMYAADTMMQKPEEEQEAKVEEVKEEPAAKETAAASKPKQEAQTQTKHEEPEVAAHVTPVDDNQEGPDYTGHNNANPSTPNPGVHQASAQSNGNETADVHIVDIQHAQTPDGHTAEAVILTDGETVGAVIDADGDGKADLFAVDTNHNNRFEDNEVQNVQGDNIRMEGFNQAYAQQNGGTHQEPQTQTYTASSNTGSDVNEVQVLGVYEQTGDQGQTMHAAVVNIEGENVALVDQTGNGIADVAVCDANHNQVIEEGEVIDVSSEQIQMSTLEDQYVAQQQQEQMQQEDTFAYNAGDDQSDYTNDADPQYV